MGETADKAGAIAIAVVDDEPDFLGAVADAIEGVEGMSLIGTAESLAGGLDLLALEPADVIIVDLGLPDGSGIDLIHAARYAWRNCDIMVATVFGDEAHVIAAIEAGATGYLLKDTSPAKLVAEIRNLHAGGSPISPLIARKLLSRFGGPGRGAAPTAPPKLDVLSQRETDVLDLITKGFSQTDVAARLGVSPHTVQTFVRRIYVKFGVKSKAEAISAARRQGILKG